MDLSSFYQQFREESAEHLRTLSDALLMIERLPPDDPARRTALDAAFRAVHTVKGGGRMLGFGEVGQLAHAIESLLGELRSGGRELHSALIDALLKAGDGLQQLCEAAVEQRIPPLALEPLIAALQAPAPALALPTAPAPALPPPVPSAPAPSAPAPAEPSEPSPLPLPFANEGSGGKNRSRQTVRVRVDRLDRLLALAGELIIGHQFLTNHLAQIGELEAAAERHDRTRAALNAELTRLRFSPTERMALRALLARLDEASEAVMRIARSISEQSDRSVAQQHALLEDLEAEVMAARLVPIGGVFAALPRIVRDVATATGKQARLLTHGETTEIDRKILEMIGDPLLHLVRNAVDHGLESPLERQAAGKASEGTITISATSSGSEVMITISDDGRGIDPNQLRASAVKRGLINHAQAHQLSDQDALELVFRPGFSTASQVSEFSGRGVGMDVVRTNIIELGGRIGLHSQVGIGTTIAMSLPLTLVTTRILLLRLSGQTFALPAAGCSGAIRVAPEQIERNAGRATVRIADRSLPLVRLGEQLSLPPTPTSGRRDRGHALIIGHDERQVVALVDDLIDEREAVVRPLGPLFAADRRFSGAIQLNDGELALLINPLLLLSGYHAFTPTSSLPIRRREQLLVVDDSFTTRELIKSILVASGYEVDAAVDGLDALDKVNRGTYDLIISDVEMPRLNGFGLTEGVRQSRSGEELPIILVTSLADEVHRRRGREAGAQAYIVKSEFSQESLLDVIAQLLRHEE